VEKSALLAGATGFLAEHAGWSVVA
jgi:hypothetical protein